MSAVRKLLPALGITPAVFDAWSRDLGSRAAWDRCLARVVERRAEARGAVTLLLQPNRHFRGFTPGQHVNVTVEIAGARETRSYSFTGVPAADGLLSLTVKRVEGGKVSTHLCTETQVGDLLELGVPFGEMTLAAALPPKLLFLAAGSGITPLMSLTRQLAAQDMPVDLTLVYWARMRAELCFVDELKALAARFPNFKLHFALTADAVTASEHLRGRPTAEQMAAVAPDLAQRSVYACGSAGFVDSVKALCSSAAGFVSEAFTPPQATNLGTGAKVRVQLAKSNRSLEIPAGMPLLTALEAQGIRPASGCRMGICNTCTCRKSEGITRDLKTGSESRDAEPALRICISSAASDLTLDL